MSLFRPAPTSQRVNILVVLDACRNAVHTSVSDGPGTHSV